jgi:hypothetical protein
VKCLFDWTVDSLRWDSIDNLGKREELEEGSPLDILTFFLLQMTAFSFLKDRIAFKNLLQQTTVSGRRRICATPFNHFLGDSLDPKEILVRKLGAVKLSGCLMDGCLRSVNLSFTINQSTFADKCKWKHQGMTVS